MKTRPAALVAIACALLLTTQGVQPVVAVDQEPPNIVVFYMDDVNPHDGRLWSNPALTPTIHDLFIASGVEFTNAIGETPLCCPGRADFLTGLHTHNNGVVANDARLFNPEMHIGRAMKEAGYASMWLGKYLNLNNYLTASDWTRHGAGWSQFDVIRGRNGDYRDYKVHTKQGVVDYPTTHSTRMVGERAVQRLREVPAQQPVFAVLSVFNMHGPNTPMPEYKTDARCSSMPPWKPANYNEANVSDKSAYISSLPLVPYPDGWPMTGYCREVLGIEWLVKTVTDELRADGRLDNTLLVFTADNGIGWGSHRLGRIKGQPSTTPVPLYMSFPARWGGDHRKIDEVVTNIDLAPTFCAIAGDACHLGPYPRGQTRPDGISLLPLLDNPGTTSLGRDAVLEAAWPGGDPQVTRLYQWQGVRTSPSHPLGQWHYVEYANGFRELYDISGGPCHEWHSGMAGDPCELTNRAGDSSLASTRDALGVRLAELFQEGRGAAFVDTRPDALIRVAGTGPYKGSGIIARQPKSSQTARKYGVAATSTTTFQVQLINRGTSNGAFNVAGISYGHSAFSVSYFYGGVDVTPAVAAGDFQTEEIPAGNFITFSVRITATDAPPDTRHAALVEVRSLVDSTRMDVVRAVAIR